MLTMVFYPNDKNYLIFLTKRKTFQILIFLSLFLKAQKWDYSRSYVQISTLLKRLFCLSVCLSFCRARTHRARKNIPLPQNRVTFFSFPFSYWEKKGSFARIFEPIQRKIAFRSNGSANMFADTKLFNFDRYARNIFRFFHI